MKIVVFGATGRSGLHVVEQAVTRDHEVTALVRNPAKLGELRERIRVILGDIQDEAQVSQAIAGSEAVLSVLGPTKNEPTYEVSTGTGHILNAMRVHGVCRLILTAGAGVGDPNDAPKLFNKVMNVLLKLVSRYVFEDMAKTVELVRSSDVDWTVVRVPMLTDDPAAGDVKVGWVGKGMGARISRADIATFLLDIMERGEYIRQAPAIST